MAIQKAQTTGTKGVMDWFDRNATSPFYSVCEIISPTKKELLFSCNEDNMDNARAILEENIAAFEQNGVNTIYSLMLHPKAEKSGYITLNTPSHAQLKFRPAELEQPVLNGYPYPAPRENTFAMNQIMEKLNALESRIAGNEYDEDEIEEQKEESPINAMLKSPELQQALISGVLGLLGGVFAHNPIQPSVNGINGINDEAVEILNTLMNKGVTLEHLRKLADMSDVKLKSLLLML